MLIKTEVILSVRLPVLMCYVVLRVDDMVWPWWEIKVDAHGAILNFDDKRSQVRDLS